MEAVVSIHLAWHFIEISLNLIIIGKSHLCDLVNHWNRFKSTVHACHNANMTVRYYIQTMLNGNDWATALELQIAASFLGLKISAWLKDGNRFTKVKSRRPTSPPTSAHHSTFRGTAGSNFTPRQTSPPTPSHYSMSDKLQTQTSHHQDKHHQQHHHITQRQTNCRPKFLITKTNITNNTITSLNIQTNCRPKLHSKTNITTNIITANITANIITSTNIYRNGWSKFHNINANIITIPKSCRSKYHTNIITTKNVK